MIEIILFDPYGNYVTRFPWNGGTLQKIVIWNGRTFVMEGFVGRECYPTYL